MPLRKINFGSKLIPDLDEEQLDEISQPGIFREILGYVTAPISTALDILDIPGSYLRGAVAGKWGERLSGRELLHAFGGDKNVKGFDWAGLAADILVDPLLFAGSVTGLTKAGKSAAIATQALDRVSELKKLRAASTGAKDIARFDKMISGIEGSLKNKLGKFTDELNPNDLLASTRLEQVNKGQRGFALSVPFGKTDAVFNSPNKGLEQLLAKVPLDGLKDSKLGKWFKERFSTKANSVFGKVKKEADSQIISQKLLEDDLQVDFWDKKLDEYMDKVTGKSKDEVLAGISEAQELLPVPERARAIEKKMIGAYKNKTVDTKAKYERMRNEIKGKIGDNPTNALVEELDKLNKTETKVLQLQEGRFNAKMVRLSERRNHLVNRLGLVAPDGSLPRQLAEQLNETGIESLDLLQKQNVAITGLNDIIGYVPHILSPDGKRLYMQNEEFRKAIGRKVIESIPDFQKKRKMRGKTVPELNKYFKEQFGIDGALVNNPFELYKAREISTQLAVNHARNVQTAIYAYTKETLSRSMIPKGTNKEIAKIMLEESKRGTVPLSKVLASSGMNKAVIGDKTVEWSIKAAVQGGETAEKHIAGVLKEAGLDNIALPKDIADDLLRMKGNYVNSNAFWRAWDFNNELMRTGLTSFNPAHIGTNALGNQFMVFNRLGAANSVKSNIDAFKTMPKTAAEFKQLINTPADKLTDLQKDYINWVKLGEGGSTFLDSSKQRMRFLNKKLDSYAAKVLDNKAIEKAFEVNNYVERQAKFAMYLGLKREGLDDFAAVEQVKKYLFDYDELTDYEKQVMRRGVLFYTFSRKNLPLSIAETFQNRRAYMMGKTSTSTLGSEDFVPEYVKDTGSVAIGDEQFADVRNPLFEANRLSTGGLGIERLAQKVMGQAVPQLKVPYELVTGKETFRGKPFKEVSRVSNFFKNWPGTHTFTTKAGDEQTVGDPRFLQVMRSLPTTRITQTAEDIVNPEISVFSMLGPRIRNLGKDKRRLDMFKEKLTRAAEYNMELRQLQQFFTVAEEPQQITREILDQLKKNKKDFARLP